MKLWLIRTFYQIWVVRAESAEKAIELIDPHERVKRDDFEVRELTVDGKTEVLLKI